MLLFLAIYNAPPRTLFKGGLLTPAVGNPISGHLSTGSLLMNCLSCREVPHPRPYPFPVATKSNDQFRGMKTWTFWLKKGQLPVRPSELLRSL